MPREHFREGSQYPARLQSISERPIENRTDGHCLLRVEFEVFLHDYDNRKLTSGGSIVCRDLVVCSHLPLDDGVAPLAQAICVADPADKWSWLRSAEAELQTRPWVKITFGAATRQVDERNTFTDIIPFDANGYEIQNSPEYLKAGWLTIPQAADYLSLSDSTLRRKLKKWEAENPELASRTIRRRGDQGRPDQPGQQREFNILLLCHTLHGPDWLKQHRKLIETHLSQRVKEENEIIEEENRMLKEANIHVQRKIIDVERENNNLRARLGMGDG
jgi:hypothetical protein